MPKVSVIIPVYNAERYIVPCLESILRQTLSDIEVICVDDGSKDTSTRICENFAQQDPRVKVIRQENGGPSKARNRGLQEAQGEWICFVDADDWVEEYMLEYLTAAAVNEVDIVICGHYQEYPDGRCLEGKGFGENQIWDRERIDMELRKFLCKGIKAYRPYGGFIGAPWARIYKREMIKTYNIRFPENMTRMEDGIFNMYAFENSREMAYICQPLYHYRLLENSTSHKMYPGIVANCEQDYKEVRKFATRYKTEDEIFQKGIDARICIWLYKYLSLYYFQPKYLQENGWWSTRREILALLNRAPYREAYRSVDLSLIKPSEKLFVMMAKSRWIGGLYLLVRGRIDLKAMFDRHRKK